MSSSRRPDKTDLIVNGVAFTFDDIYRVIDEFYRRVQQDEDLKVPFQSVHDWPEHIDRLTHFWWTRFGGQPYLFTFYNPVAKHYHAGFNAFLLAKWLGLFHQTLSEKLNADQAQLWGLVAEKMGQGLSMKNELYKEALRASENT